MSPTLVAQIRKFLIAAAGFASSLLAVKLIPSPYDTYVAAGLAFLASLGVYKVPNTMTPQQLMAQPNYTPAVAHVPMPIEEPVKYDPAANVNAGLQYVDERYGQPKKALGRRPAKNAPALRFADHLKAIPDHPITDLAPQLSWPIDHNDTCGCCVVAGLDHYREVVYTSLGAPYTPWTDGELLKLYQTQNPTFRSWQDGGSSRDGGMDVQTFLEHLVKQGVILGFAKVDHTNVEEMKAAIYLGLGVVTGEVLTAKNMREQVWDYHPRDPQEGGHCTVSVGYTPAEAIVSWGALYSVTDAFLKHNIEEAWFLITQAHVDHPAFRAGFDLASFAAAYQEITGATFPVPVTPEPPVPPVIVPPTPATPDDQHLWAAVSTWVAGGHGSTTRAVATALKEWAKAKQLT